jgi:hypothetical protein
MRRTDRGPGGTVRGQARLPPLIASTALPPTAWRAQELTADLHRIEGDFPAAIEDLKRELHERGACLACETGTSPTANAGFRSTEAGMSVIDRTSLR